MKQPGGEELEGAPFADYCDRLMAAGMPEVVGLLSRQARLLERFGFRRDGLAVVVTHRTDGRKPLYHVMPDVVMT